MTTDAREEAERRWPRPRQLDSRDWANDTEETLRYAFEAGAEWQAAQQSEPGHRKPTDDESMQSLAGDIAREFPEHRTTEVVVGHRLGFWYPVEDPDTLTDAEIAMADDYLEAHIQWRISRAQQSETHITNEIDATLAKAKSALDLFDFCRSHQPGLTLNEYLTCVHSLRALVAALEGEHGVSPHSRGRDDG